MSLYQYHMCPSVQCPLSILSHSVESCGTCLRRPGIVFHNISNYVDGPFKLHNLFIKREYI